MRNKEQLEAAKNVIKGMIFCGLCTTGDCNTCIKKIAKDSAIEAIEKQISKEPIYKPVDVIYQRAHCPTCGKELYEWNFQALHCSCGQRLGDAEE